MSDHKDEKRKRSNHDDDSDYRKEKKSKRPRSRSKSPARTQEKDPRRKRRHSRSRSPEKRPKNTVNNEGVSAETDVKKEIPERKKKETDMLNTRTGGAYIPPARLRMMQAQITDKSSIAYQRLAWEALKKSIHGHINKINVGNIGIIIKELLKENIVRGRGLLCRSVIQAQAASPTFTNVYAALVAAVNSRFPNIGELLLKRLVIQFKRGFKRNDKPICISSASFIAHLVNQRVAHEILALELLTLLVETPTDDSVEVSIAFLKECGQKLTEVSSKGVNAIFEMLRNILHEGQLDKRVQYMIEVMFQVWKDGFKDHPAVVEELELVPEEEQFTHLLMLDDATDSQDILNVFKFDEKYEENEQKYKTLCKEILGSDGESEEGSGESGSEESDDEDEDEETPDGEKKMTIIDNTETNLVALRRTIYLTINSSLDFEECAHKLMKMQLKPGQEVELCHMFLDCCAEQRTYEKFYGLLAQRFCNINRIYIEPFEEIFRESYSTAHRLDTNRLRNVSKFFAHLLFTDSINWEVLECVKLNEEETTSSSRIYIKILFQELAEYMGLKKLNDRLKDPTLQEAFQGIFPRDNPKNTRFSINFFTSIGLGGLTDELRENLKQMPKVVPPPLSEIQVGSESDSSSSSSSDSSSSSSDSSDSEDDSSKKKKSKKKKSNKDGDKTPKTPEVEEPAKNTERWGHDGFYDTYGKGARRFENDKRTDKDNFVRPRDVDRRDTRDERHRGREDKRDDEYRSRKENGSREDSSSTRDDRSNRDDRSKEDRKGRDDERSRREDRSQREQEERSNRDDRSKEDRKGRDDERSRREDRSQREQVEDDNRSRREDRLRKDDKKAERDDRSRKEDKRAEREDDRSNREDRSRKEDKRAEREDDRSNREDRSRKDDKRTEREDDRSNREDRSRKEDKRTEREDDRSNREDWSRKEDKRAEREDDRSYREDRSRKEDKRTEREDDRSNREDRSRKEDKRTEREDDRSNREDRSRKEDKRAEREDDRSNREDRSRKEDKRTEREDDRSNREDRSRKEDRARRDDDSDREDKRSRKEDEGRKKDRRDDDRTRETEEKSNRSRKENRSRRNDSDDEDSSEDDRSREYKSRRDGRSKRDGDSDRRYDKENKSNKDRNRESRREDSDSSEDDRRRRKKERDRYKESEDGWDIRGSSIRREVPVGRYWDN